MIRLDQIKGFIADLARPLAIISTSFAASWGIVVVAYRVENGNDGALYIAAALTCVGAIYIGKAFEVTRIAGHNAEVEKARAQAAPAPDTDGELPLDQRVTR
jgi:hypothetical protein